MSTKRTYQPSSLKRKKRHGFRFRLSSKKRRKTLNNRRNKKRYLLTV